MEEANECGPAGTGMESMMKILYVSYHNPHFLTLTEYIEEAIRSLGHDLVSYDDRRHVIPGRIRHRFPWIHRLDLEHINAGLLRLAVQEKPDLLLVSEGWRVLPETVMKIKQLGIPLILWTVDAPVDFSHTLAIVPYYDHLFCGGTEAKELLARAGFSRARWLPFACDTGYHHRVELSNDERLRYSRDVAFVGSFYPNRWDILRELGEFDLGIWGPHWEKAPHGTDGGCRIHDCYLKPAEWIKIFSGCTINVIIHYQDGRTPCYQASPKVYEALACRSFVLVDRQLDVFSLFEDDRHLVGFDDVTDLKKKIRYYLKHPEERERISDAGCKAVLEGHTYRHRISEMLSILKEIQ
jgi:spore maturation protein CgeB